MEQVYNVFDISKSQFWNIVKQLNILEIVDLYESEIAKISDQIISSYLFYEIVFKRKELSFDKFLDNFYVNYS
jgi:hypothetical protein